MDVGVRLQSIRKLKGLSQRELAKRAGVTNSTISMIEKNSVSPSISSLKKVLGGIPMSLVEFFSLDLEQDNQTQVVYRADELTDLSSGAAVGRSDAAEQAVNGSRVLVADLREPHLVQLRKESINARDLVGDLVGANDETVQSAHAHVDHALDRADDEVGGRDRSIA